MKRQSGSAALVMLVVLGLLALTAAYYKREYDKEHDLRVQAEANLKTANAATETCNDSIAGLEEAARKQGAKAEKDRKAASDRRKAKNQQADRELATPATVPGNDCKSAQDRVTRILTERKRP